MPIVKGSCLILTQIFNKALTPTLVGALLCLLPMAGGQAQLRFIPQDTAVVFTPPSPTTGGERAALKEAMRVWRQSPGSLEGATAAARLAFLTAMHEGDPRWLGNARAMLQPWWEAKGLSAEASFIRSLVRQGLHDFDGGLADLDAAISQEPERPEFWAWRFAIHLVRAEIDPARQACSAIGSRFGEREALGCAAVLLYRTGDPRGAIRLLDKMAGHPDGQGRYALEWLTFHRGEARRVAGEAEAAKRIWRSYLNSGPQPHVIRLALVELLNDQKDFAAAWQLNQSLPRSDALLVQAIRSARALGRLEAGPLLKEFQLRVAQQEARGDTINERPLIGYHLLIQGDAAVALDMAQKSWLTQREPADAALYAEAALRSGRPNAAAEVLLWRSQTGYKEASLDLLLDQLQLQTATRDRP